MNSKSPILKASLVILLMACLISGCSHLQPSANISHSIKGVCGTETFDKVAGISSNKGFSVANCEKGWALASGSSPSGALVGLFKLKVKSWVLVNKTYSGSPESTTANSLNVATIDYGIEPSLLQSLAKPFDLKIRQSASADVITASLKNPLLGAGDSMQVSSVLDVNNQSWLVAEVPDGPISTSSMVNPYPDGTVDIYTWIKTKWVQAGKVHGYMGPVGPCCGIEAENLTGSHEPDFAITGGGAADTNWLSIVSDVGGNWHLAPFDYGYSLTTVVNGVPMDNGVSTELDDCSCAGGPTTGLFETYQDGAFRPAMLPGPNPSCSLTALQNAADPWETPIINLTKFACDDGWAIATGTGVGFNGPIIGLFESYKGKWKELELDNGASLGSYPGFYDIPLSLLDKLAGKLNAGFKAALASASIFAESDFTAPYPDGIITVGSTSWLVVEMFASTTSNNLDLLIYRWSGSAWVESGVIKNLPPYQRVGNGWFKAVVVAGSSDPGFAFPYMNPPETQIVTDLGGTWHLQ
ncbi:MAG: hypothetical protein HKL80_01560 [Acidimicrobiales bacterium]|nr:hypothetical protein [Acidimicrobiales bacterium]